MTRTIVSLVAALALAACGSDSPTETARNGDPSLAGTYLLVEVNESPVPADVGGMRYEGGEIVLRRNGTAEFAIEHSSMVLDERRVRRESTPGTWFSTEEAGRTLVAIEFGANSAIVGQVSGSSIHVRLVSSERLRFDRK